MSDLEHVLSFLARADQATLRAVLKVALPLYNGSLAKLSPDPTKTKKPK